MHIRQNKSYKITVFVLAVVMAVCLTPFPAMAEESDSIAVTSPVEGDIWEAGTSRQIAWNLGEAPGSEVKIELLAGGEVCRGIADSAVTEANGHGNFVWTVPGDLPPGECYSVRITSLADTGRFAVSKTFTVSSPSPAAEKEPGALIAIASPSGEADWSLQTSHEIEWTFSENPGGDVKVELIKDDVPVLTIADGTSIGKDGSGRLTWQLPAGLTTGDGYRIRISSLADLAYTVTGEMFAITNPLKVTVPAEVGSLTAGSCEKITWSFGDADLGDTVRIELLRDGALLSTITESVPAGLDGTGSYDWMIPADMAPGDAYQIKIICNDYPDINALSGNLSFVQDDTGKKALNITSPYEGAVWAAGTDQSIEWNFTQDPGTNVKIELFNKDTAVLTIAENISIGTEGSGSFAWKVPEDLLPGGDYTIRISSIERSGHTAEGGLFTICGAALFKTDGIAALAAGSTGNWADAVTVTSLSGGGTALNPYLIQSAEDLAFMAKMVNSGNAAYGSAVYRLTACIDLSIHTWIPIGTYDDPFSGTFDGGGNTVSGLMIGLAGSPFAAECAGLFGFIDATAILADSTVATAAVYGTDPALNIGGLVGYNAGGLIENCYFTGNVAGYDETAYVGGLAGCNEGSITSCFSAGNVSGGNVACIGGLVGCNYGYILNSDAKCAVNGGAASYTGGFVGNNYSGVVFNCYAAGDVTGGSATADLASYTGGFAGYSYFSILNCYATGNVTGGDAVPGHKSLVGGFIGKNYGDVINCFAAGNVTGGAGATLGGFTGGNNSSSSFVRLINTYWNINAVQTVGGINRTADMLGNGESTGADLPCGLPESVMKGGVPAAGITYVCDDSEGTTTTGITQGAFIEALNGGIGALDTANTYMAWTWGGYPVFSADIAPTFYPVTVESEGNGTCSANHTIALAGEKVALSATPGSNYHFKEWRVISPSGLQISGNSFTMPAEAVTIKAVFEKNVPPAHEIIVENDGNGTGTASPATASPGETVTLQAVPKSGYHFKEWQVISPSGLQISGNSFTMPGEAVTVKAVFEKNVPPAHEIIVENDGNGTGTASPAIASPGETVTLQAIPKSGYHFKEWQVINPSGLQIAGNSFAMPGEAVNVKALFAQDTCIVTFSNDENTVYAAITVPTGSAVGSENWPADPVKSGYVFGGWHTEPNGSGMQFTSDSNVTTDIAVYAKWVQSSTDGGSSTGGDSGNNGGSVQMISNKGNNNADSMRNHKNEERQDKPGTSSVAASPVPTTMPSTAPFPWLGQNAELRPSLIEKDEDTGKITLILKLDTLPEGTAAIQLENGDIIQTE